MQLGRSQRLSFRICQALQYRILAAGPTRPALGAFQQVACASLGQRGQQTAAAGQPSLRSKLRELYKRVHPDLFQNHESARLANERSFKLLQEYLAMAKKGGQIGRTAGLPYHFEFYLHADTSDLTESVDQLPAPEGLKRVALTLPPPARLEGAGAQSELPKATQAALGKLLHACGLATEFDGALGRQGEQALPTERLREFLPAAAEVARQRYGAVQSPRQRMDMLRLTLRMGRQVSVGFSKEAARQGAAQQALLMEQVVAALDRVPHLDVGGINIMLGAEYGTDDGGNLWLHASGSVQDWIRQFERADMNHCRGRRKMVASLRRLEASVAQVLGISLIHAVPEIMLQPPYTECLQRLAAAANERGRVLLGQAREVPVTVVPARSPLRKSLSDPVPVQLTPGELQTLPADEAAARGFGVDASSGLMNVPVDASPDLIYSWLEKHALAAAAAARQQFADKSKLDDLTDRTWRRLRMRALSRHPELGREQFQAACLRLLAASKDLALIFDGLKIQLGLTNQVAADGDVIEVAWNFEV